MVIWSETELKQPDWFNPLDCMDIAIGLLAETIEPAKLVVADLTVSWHENVCPCCNKTVKVALAACPIIAVLGVIKTVVLFWEATMSNEENDLGEVAGDWFQNSCIGT